MTAPDVAAGGGPPIREQIIATALEKLGDADFAQLLKAITPEILAEDAAWAASTVRYHFRSRTRDAGGGAGALAFQRRELGLAMLEVSLADALRAMDVAADGYERAADDLRERRSTDGVVEAIGENLAAFIPGASVHDVSARERMYHLAVAVADTDAGAARLLRTSRADKVERFERVYAVYLAALDRQMAPGRTIRDLADAVSSVLDGHLARLRFEPGSSSDWVPHAVFAVFAAFTVRRDGEPWDPTAELLR